jgi:serine/threonine protein kinase
MPAIHGASGPPTSVVQGYEILETLAEGGMGKIYLARQHALNRVVCVKVLSIPAGEDADLCRTRFCREAELLASVSHPHILSIFDFGATPQEGLPFLVTEYIEAGDLRRRMTPGQAMPVGQVRSILQQMGDALAFLHGKGILHRDLKPENVLMPTESLVKVGDFGIAVMQDKAGLLTQSVRGMGTVGYVSPEQQYGLKIDERTDEFSLAAVCYELLTGRRPLGSFPPPSQLNPLLCRQVDTVILRGLAEEPKHRFDSVREFVTALDRSLAASPAKRGKLPLALVGLLSILLVAAGLAWLGGRASQWKVPFLPGEALAATDAIARNTNPVKPEDATKPTDSPATAPKRSAEFEKLVKLRAYVIWVQSGRPQGKAGEAVKEKNWTEAESQILKEVECRAYKIWEQQGSPTAEAGEVVREQNMRAGEVQLLDDTLKELREHPLD